MAATPFTGILKFTGANGRNIQYRITASDVANEYYLFPNGGNFIQIPLDSTYFITDVILDGAGKDTTRGVIYVNQKLTPEQIANSANLTTNVSRQFMGSPIGFAAGSTLQVLQVA